MDRVYTEAQIADILSVSKRTVRSWEASGKLTSTQSRNNQKYYPESQLIALDKLGILSNSAVQARELPLRPYKIVELFAGAGGLALGMEKAGLTSVLLNEIDKYACETLRKNRPHWNVIEGDIRQLDFRLFKDKIDVVTGGFPCQAFSYAGKKLGLEDARGTLFYEFARAVKYIRPLICVGENVRGLLQHEKGRTLQGMISVLDEIGYDVLPPRVLKAIFHRVPQKRERLLIVGIRKDADIRYDFPVPHKELFGLRDALKAGSLYDEDVPESVGISYPESKRAILDAVPPGGYWRDLPIELQKKYMKGSFHLSGGKTGIARRMHWDEPCLTLTCSPAQMQTERCHPEETRPFTVREYARIQTFPDDWRFAGSVAEQYKQIGNAVPVNLAEEVGHSLVKALNEYYARQTKPCDARPKLARKRNASFSGNIAASA